MSVSVSVCLFGELPCRLFFFCISLLLDEVGNDEWTERIATVNPWDRRQERKERKKNDWKVIRSELDGDYREESEMSEENDNGWRISSLFKKRERKGEN